MIGHCFPQSNARLGGKYLEHVARRIRVVGDQLLGPGSAFDKSSQILGRHRQIGLATAPKFRVGSGPDQEFDDPRRRCGVSGGLAAHPHVLVACEPDEYIVVCTRRQIAAHE
jgi:hypothetical protein